jgi:beta-barrel assembly-enhancing protease
MSRPVHKFRLIIKVLALCWLSAAPAAELPDLGNSADALLSSGAEVRLGHAFMRSVRTALPVLDDPLLISYLETLGNTLVAANQQAIGRFTFFLIDAPVVNAFAGPGGYVGVYSGLILAAETESELAAVIAHEIAHVTQRHLLRGFEDQSKFAIPAMAVLIAAAILGAQVSADAGMAAAAGLQAATVQRQINFTRDNENEADRLGIATLARAGHDPYAMAGFFGRLAQAGRLYDNHAPEFLRTHPVNSNRIADALGRADEFGARQRADSLRFHLTRARLRERAEARTELAITHSRERLREGRYRNESAERYGYALALLRARQLTAAETEVVDLLNAAPNQPEFIILMAQLQQAQQQPAAAVALLKRALVNAPSDWVLRMAYAEALIANNQAALALDELTAIERQRPGSAALYELLEQAALKTGNEAATHRYRAEKYYAEGELEPALRQLEIALRQQKLAYHDAARIQARLDIWREELRAQKQRDKK